MSMFRVLAILCLHTVYRLAESSFYPQPKCLPLLDVASQCPSLAVFTAWSSWSTPAVTRSMKCLPASVSRTPRAWRSNSRTPRLSSSAFTRALTLDWLIPSALAACRKFRCSATAMNWTREMSGILPDRIPTFTRFRWLVRRIGAGLLPVVG